MGWEVLVIPIIGVAVWIISTLVRGAEEAKRGPPPPRRRPERATDLDRFLREVQRRREAAEREEPRPRRAPPQEEAPPVVVAVEALPVAQPVIAVALRPIEAPPLPVLPAEPMTPPPRRRAAPVAPSGLRELLRRDGLRQAVILSEILGPPLARRGGRLPRSS